MRFGRSCLFFLLLVFACGQKSSPPPESPTTPLRYEFQSRFVDGSSVAYPGQVLRHLLIDDLKAYIGSLKDLAKTRPIPASEVLENLSFFYEFNGQTGGTASPLKTTTPALAQASYSDVSTSAANLIGKIAGHDLPGPHRDWATEFAGWGAKGSTSPDGLVKQWFQGLAILVEERSSTAALPAGADGKPIDVPFVTESGLNYQELLQKFLLGAIALSQGTDDYLDDDIPDDGLLARNERDGTNPYTKLEHKWDEAFGYFGAARDYLDQGTKLVSETGYRDSNGDGKIDLATELSWGHSTNAAKRDEGAKVKTDFSTRAFTAFINGRHLISHATETLTVTELVELKGYRDVAVRAWEEAIAATVVHYLNEVLTQMKSFGTADYDFKAHAKEWSELKGFALSFQFNPRSPVSDADFEIIHQKLGTAPALPGAPSFEAYRTGLREIKALIQEAYDFDPANMGNDDGEGGW